MGDFFGDVGNYFGELTGWNQAGRAKKAEEDTAQTNREARARANEQYARMQQLTSGYTGDPTVQAKQAYDFARQNAGQQGAQIAQMAGKQAVSAGRTAGLNPGQAAILAGQQTGNTFLQAQNAALQQALAQFNAQQSANLQVAGMNAGLAVPAGLQQYQNTDASGAINSTLGGLGSALGVVNQKGGK